MSERIRTDKNLIDPIYFQSRANESIEIGEVPVRFTFNGTEFRKTAKVRLRFTPKHRLFFTVPLDDLPHILMLQFLAIENPIFKLVLEDRNLEVETFYAGISDELGGLVLEPKTSGIAATQPTTSIQKVTFHLFNFPSFHGPENYVIVKGDPGLESHIGCEMVTLRADGWTIVIAATEMTSDLVKSLKSDGGFVVTHVGTMSRDDGTVFDDEQLDELLSCLHYFLSFALGRWAGLALPVGVDVSGNRVFEEWGLRHISSGVWNGGCAWWDSMHSELLSEVFPGFVVLWKSDLWQRTLHEALYFYIGAKEGNGIGVDSSLILAQAALERLSWNYCVFDKKLVSEAAFQPRGLKGPDKLRMLLSSVGIPLLIATDLQALNSNLGKNKKPRWHDGPHAITDIRNAVVHPDPKTPLEPNSEYDGWRLAMWYIDLVVLFLCGHQGRYSNRLTTRWAGTLEWVPWVKQPPS